MIDDIHAALARILATPCFRSSRRRKLLSYLVEETLAGRGDRLKGYSIAIEVFERNDDFDAQSDPVVRLEARRLRRDLDSYYAGEGYADPVRLIIPKGQYAVDVDWGPKNAGEAAGLPAASPSSEAETTAAASAVFLPHLGADDSRPPPRALIPVAFALAVLAFGCLSWLVSGSRPAPIGRNGPSVIVLPFKPLGDDPRASILADGVSQQLISELMRFAAIRVFSPRASFGESADADATELIRRFGVSYVVSGSVSTAAGQVRISAKVVNAKTGEVKWSESIDRRLDAASLLAVQTDVVAGIAWALGEPYGAVKSDVSPRVLSQCRSEHGELRWRAAGLRVP